VPKEGTNIWMDNMIIPSNAKEVDLAHKWINFMLDNEVATKNTIYVGYTSPVVAAFEAVTGAGGDYEGNIAYGPRMDNPLDEEYKYNDALKEVLTDKWTRVKAQ
jgi:spermidine/putrescine transport system permease protein